MTRHAQACRAAASGLAPAFAVGTLVLLAGCTAYGYPAPVPETSACFDGRDQDFDGLVDMLDPECDTFGRTCTGDADCATLRCGTLGDGRRVCVPPCEDGCLPGWTCDPSDRCTCSACAERCDGMDDDCDGRIDEESCALGETCDPSNGCACDGDAYFLPVDEVDLLFVVDDTASFQNRLTRVAAEIERMVRILATGDADGDGDPEHAPVRSLHVAVVTSDLGVGPQPDEVPTCDASGEDGVLRRPLGSCTVAGASGVFEFRPVLDDIDEYSAAVRCVLGSEVDGCGFEAPLEAMLRALSPAAPQPWVAADYVPPVFRGGAAGHGDGANAGFLREGSSLGVVLVTDENDCSTDVTELFALADPRYAGIDLNLRCSAFAEVLHPIARYVDGLRALRPDPRRIQFASLLGIPVGAEALSFEEILAHPEMQEIPSPELTSRLTPVCIDAGTPAFPSRRIVELARDLECAGATATLRSICASDYAPVIDGLLERTIGAIDRRVCVARAVSP